MVLPNRKAFTLIELMIVLAIMGLLIAVAVGGVAKLFVGGGNYFDERTATIKVLKLYPITSDGETSYRCYAEILHSPSEDENLGAKVLVATTFEITDSFMKGQMLSADLFGKLEEGKVFEITYYGARSGMLNQFPKIIAVGGPGGGIPYDLYD